MNLIECYLCNKQFDPNKRRSKNKSRHSKKFNSLYSGQCNYLILPSSEKIPVSNVLDMFCSKNCINKYIKSDVKNLTQLLRDLNFRKLGI